MSDQWQPEQLEEFWSRVGIRSNQAWAKAEAADYNAAIDANLPVALHAMVIGLTQSAAELEVRHGQCSDNPDLAHARSALGALIYTVTLANEMDASPEYLTTVTGRVSRELIDMARAALGHPR